MPSSEILDVAVAGGGVLGLTCAHELTRRGASVVLIDPGGASASSVAAGMLAPAAESLSDWRESGVDHSMLFRASAALWPDLATRLGVVLARDGVEWRGPAAEGAVETLARLGFAVENEGSWPVAADDARIDVAATLAALRATPGLRTVSAQVTVLEPLADGWSVHSAEGLFRARKVVVALGATGRIQGPAALDAALAHVQPIRGQIGWSGQVAVERTVRGQGVYVAPAPAGGVVLGASMGVGRTDRAVDANEADALVRAAKDQLGLNVDVQTWRVGVRGATPDGLPMAGAIDAGLSVALAPRRNGWLLAPLVAGVVADAVENRAPTPVARGLDPLRFA